MAIAIDFETLRELEHRSTGVRYDLGTLYGLSGWPSPLRGALPQVAAVALMVDVVVDPDSGLLQSDPLQVFRQG